MSACVAFSAAAPNMPECMSVVSRPHAEVEIDHPAHADVEARLLARDHRAVEDQSATSARPSSCVDPLDDRVAADLLLAVEGEADVDRQRALRRELPHGLDEQEQCSPCRRPLRARTGGRRAASARTAATPRARAGRAAGRRSARSRGPSARTRRRSDAAISPMTSGLAPQGTSSAVPPAVANPLRDPLGSGVDVGRVRRRPRSRTGSR